MKWIGITGSWRHLSAELKTDLIGEVEKIMKNGHGLVTGGALGVDYHATKQVMKLNPSLNRLKVYLPTPVDIYVDHYKKRAEEGVIGHKQANLLEKQLLTIKNKNPKALICAKHRIVNKRTYYFRNKSVVEVSNNLIAFHVNKSRGTTHTINYAKKLTKPIKIYSYKTQNKNS